jgi:predicted  nucleic acid-binding Zn-ribbon protein
MPHQCTDCGRTFDDGSKQMLSGCPDCGGNKFQYRPDGADAEETPSSGEQPPDPPEPPVDSSVARTVGNAATAVRDFVGTTPSPPEEQTPSPAAEQPTPESESSRGAATGTAPSETASENPAQKSARSDIVSKDDLPPVPESPATDRPTPVLDDDSESPRGSDRPDLSELRDELNDQFESIKVLDPGKYELNLMELYDREEYIIALQEDGKYTIQVPDRWEDG